MSREQQRESKRARRKARLAARDPGSTGHIRALLRHRTLGPHARLARRTGEQSKPLEREIQFARAREAKRLLDYGRALDAGADRMDKLVKATTP